MNQISDLMTKDTISVSPETPIVEAARILSEKKLDGVPVVNDDKVVVGILTEYDLLTKGTSIHLPTFLKLLKEFDLYKKDKSLIKGEIAAVLSTKVKDVMNGDPMVMAPTASIEEATKTFAEHHRVNPIPIVDGAHKLVGVLSRYDLIKLYSGGASALSGSLVSERKLDEHIDVFLKSFERRFLFVSKFRTRFWLLFSIMFILIGFFIATAVIIRISPK
jgi:CBS domain-containing protein